MGLKKLVSDLTQGLKAYPNHNNPSTSALPSAVCQNQWVFYGVDHVGLARKILYSVGILLVPTDLRQGAGRFCV